LLVSMFDIFVTVNKSCVFSLNCRLL